MIPTKVQLREMADAAQAAAQGQDGYQRVYAEAVEDILRYLAGDAPLSGELEVIVGHVVRQPL